MNTKITVSNRSCVVAGRTLDDYRRAMQILGYESYREDPVLRFYYRCGNAEAQDTAIVEPTSEPITMTPDEWRDRRKSLNLTQKALAEKLGVNVMTIKRRESGETNIDAEAALAIHTL